MKKIFFAIAAVMACFACSEEQPFSYRGLAFNMPTAQFVDSLIGRGLVVDSAASDSGRLVVLNNPAARYRVLVAYAGDKLQAIQENYQASTNDSTRMMWQQLRDGFEKELDAWPDCPMLKDNHKIANFDTSTGFISVVLQNTYRPTLTVQYQPKKEQK